MAVTIKDLSGATNGRPIVVVATSSAGTTLHTTNANDNEIFMWATNSTSITQRLVIQWGGTTSTDEMYSTIGAFETHYIIPGWYLSGSLVVRAYSTTANAVNIVGHELESS